ncbi:TobH protein [Mycolicibacterium diernhoferi]|uniref:TobH protein n=2 Tax=Mycolicibacterium diernhoferi TaxID=1801 RepID=A0A1Q4HA02_9MYCO|nr:TobH protein [Mycolicibacterium diernhoferi]OJZ64378.1 TobH protein [Mycolicibacterium diernhoferi]PEG53423.1 TobH protein [Mycolicibacterium diernhoferi]QYL24194.1 TobH protein [Mycolicibacterium diernhoferi]
MTSRAAIIDLDDVEGLLAADRDGLLRAAAMSGAQVRATAAAVDEGALDPLRADVPPRTLIWVADGGPARAAGSLLAAVLGPASAVPIVVAAELPPWTGALDVVVVAGADAGNPVLVSAAATGVRRGARVVVAAPHEGPLREVTAGRAAVLAPRLPVPEEFGLTRYLAAGVAILAVVDAGVRVDIAALADGLDAEALRNSASRDLFTNPAKSLADRLSGREVVLAGDNDATLALAQHSAAVLLRVARQVVAAVGLSDALAALGRTDAAPVDYEAALFHDEELDGPLPARTRTVVLTSDEQRPAVVTRTEGFADLDVVSADDVPDLATTISGVRPEQQLATVAVRLEMTAVYLRLVRG